jgi:hypothetical protein
LLYTHNAQDESFFKHRIYACGWKKIIPTFFRYLCNEFFISSFSSSSFYLLCVYDGTYCWCWQSLERRKNVLIPRDYFSGLNVIFNRNRVAIFACSYKSEIKTIAYVQGLFDFLPSSEDVNFLPRECESILLRNSCEIQTL